MININCFLVTYDRLYDKVVNQLSKEELSSITCYHVQKKVEKQITSLVDKNVKEWELPWNDFSYQKKQYYEYGTMIHILNNPQLVEETTHIGLFHYDVIFNPNSINQMKDRFSHTPDFIFYQKLRDRSDLYLNDFEVEKICEFLSQKMNIVVDHKKILETGWISEALSVTPKHVFLKFAKFVYENREEIEDILLSNKWGIMNTTKHRICGIIERMWGFYLVSCGLQYKQMNVIHDWNSYSHKHFSDENWIK